MDGAIVNIWPRLEHSMTLDALCSPVSQGGKETMKWTEKSQRVTSDGSWGSGRTYSHWSTTWVERVQTWSSILGRQQEVDRSLNVFQGQTLHLSEPKFSHLCNERQDARVKWDNICKYLSHTGPGTQQGFSGRINELNWARALPHYRKEATFRQLK